MAFIKVGDTVINTGHIVAVELDRVSISGKCGVVISMAAKGGLFKRQPREFWKSETWDEESEAWGDEQSDPPDDPPPPPTISQRPWEPQSLSPLSTVTPVEPFDPSIP